MSTLSQNFLNVITNALASPSAANELVALLNVTAGAASASSVLVADSNKDLSGLRNLGVTNLDAGASGTAGTVDIFPATAAKGKTQITSANNSGDTTTTIAVNAQAAARTLNVPDCGSTTGYFLLLDAAQTTAGKIKRADLTGEVVEVAIPLINARVWDAVGSLLPTAGANDDLGLISNSFGTTAPTIETGDSKAATTTRRCIFIKELGPEYVDGQAVTLRLNAGMKTTVSDTTATIDAEVYRVAAPSTDICATAAQSINNLTAANKDFTITPTTLVSGDVLLIRVTIAIVDGATGTAVIGQLNKVSLRPTAKG